MLQRWRRRRGWGKVNYEFSHLKSQRKISETKEKRKPKREITEREESHDCWCRKFVNVYAEVEGILDVFMMANQKP